ncbi:MAG: asparagine synthase (glutamine-hydrolyzing) [Candidatus Coatesbacteria bacterium]|nr:asparagine synthase (glutamine-hydrolyzing) [Candidatus Coatesbacteria bacterium]
MCGICGIISKNQKNAEKDILIITKKLHHRGPDSSGFHISSEVSLGHTRLSIIDIEGGSQPIYNEDKSMVLVYNGEIYNASELRNELLKKGHKFSSRTDSEIIIHLFEEENTDSFKRLDGFFAFTLYDFKQKTLYMARDKFGQKPLYYRTNTEHELVFSSEIDSIAFFKPLEINTEALASLFYFGFNIYAESIFKGIFSLPASHYAIFRNSKIEISEYSDFPFTKISDEQEFSARTTEDLIRSAVKKRLISDTPVSVFLSGGIDSALIAAMAREAGADLSHFSLKPAEEFYDESSTIKTIVSRYNLKHQFLDIPSIMEEDLRSIVYSLNEPLTDPTSLLTRIICEKVGKELGFKVALSGMGGDELFLGYRRLLFSSLSGKIGCLPSFIRNIGEILRSTIPSGRENKFRNMARWIFNSISSIGLPYQKSYFKSRDQFNGIRLFSGDITSLENELMRKFSLCEHQTMLNTLLIVEIVTNLRENLLIINDRIGMSCSLEIRSPFLDIALFDYLFSFPDRMKFTSFRLKPLLKKIAAGKLPEEYLKAPKKGFDLPLGAFFRNIKNRFVDELLSRKRLQKHSLLDIDKTEMILKEHRSGKFDHSRIIFTLIQFQIWYEKYFI